MISGVRLDENRIELGSRENGELSYGTILTGMNYIEKGEFDPKDGLKTGILEADGYVSIGDFNAKHMIDGINVYGNERVEGGRFDDVTGLLLEGYRVTNGEVPVFERGRFIDKQLEGWGVSSIGNYIALGNFNHGKLMDGVHVSAYSMVYETTVEGRRQMFRLDKQYRTLYIGEFGHRSINGYRLNFDNFENPIIERRGEGQELPAGRNVIIFDL
jgi:hypothetical protein